MLSDEEADDLEAGTHLMATRVDTSHGNPASTKPISSSRLADVWDEGEELFDIGGDSDDEGERSARQGTPPHAKK